METFDWRGRRVFVTGVCGTVGRALVARLREAGADEIVGIDNAESELFHMGEDPAIGNLSLAFADVRDAESIRRRMRGCDVVFHLAALKHVALSERSPGDAIATNVHGVQNIIAAAFANGVSRVVFTSSDKAVNPTSVMGTSKLLGERLISAANAHRQHGDPTLSSTRFGNVLGSRGSVVPLFLSQVRRGGPVTLTDPRMTRFFMTIRQSVDLIVESAELARGGEAFVTKMPVARIRDLADVLIREMAPRFGHRPENIEVKVIGSKPGEKLYEELMTDEEVRRTIELEKYYVVKAAFSVVPPTKTTIYPGALDGAVTDPYRSTSEMALDQRDVAALLDQAGLLSEKPL